MSPERDGINLRSTVCPTMASKPSSSDNKLVDLPVATFNATKLRENGCWLMVDEGWTHLISVL